MKSHTEIAMAETATSEIAQLRPARQARFTAEQITQAHIHETSELPSLVETRAAPVPLSVEYWSPEKEGEFKRCWILGIEYMEVPDMQTGEIRELECVLLVEETPDGGKARYFNASKILVSNVKDAINRGEIVPRSILTPVQIAYLGLKRCKNGNNAARWQILPLIVASQG
jgi:hypothetical protein